MARNFQPIIKKARFVNRGIQPQQMVELGTALLKSIQTRMDRAQDIHDAAAPPLSLKYAAYKNRRYGSEVRDLKYSGRTRRGMAVLQAGQNYCYIGFTDPEALRRVKINNTRSRQWGVSPQNDREVHDALRRMIFRPIAAEQEGQQVA